MRNKAFQGKVEFLMEKIHFNKDIYESHGYPPNMVPPERMAIASSLMNERNITSTGEYVDSSADVMYMNPVGIVNDNVWCHLNAAFRLLHEMPYFMKLLQRHYSKLIQSEWAPQDDKQHPIVVSPVMSGFIACSRDLYKMSMKPVSSAILC